MSMTGAIRPWVTEDAGPVSPKADVRVANGKFLEQWCTAAMRSRVEPMTKIARMLRAHKPLILNGFEAREQVALGAIEGLNNRLKADLRRSYGFRTYRAKSTLYHKLGARPEPGLTHRFC